MADEEVVIKINFEEAKRPLESSIQVFPANISFEDFELTLKVYSECEEKDHIKICYLDNENDWVEIGCNEELEEAFKSTKRCHNVLQLKVRYMLNAPGARDKRQIIGEDVKPLSTGIDAAVANEKCLEEDETDGFEVVEQKNEPVEQTCVGDKHQFLIVNEANGLYLSTEDAKHKPGVAIVMKPKASEYTDQLSCQSFIITKKRTVLLNDSHMTMIYRDNVAFLASRGATWQYCDGYLYMAGQDQNMVLTSPGVIGLPPVIEQMRPGDKRQVWRLEPCEKPIFGEQHLFQVFRKQKEQIVKSLDTLTIAFERLTDEKQNSSDSMAAAHRCEKSVGNDYHVDVKESVLKRHLMSTGAHVHNGRIICDGCNKCISGIRYKCGNCPNFDLCERCEDQQVHDSTHCFLKIRRPLLASPNMKPLLRVNLYNDILEETSDKFQRGSCSNKGDSLPKKTSVKFGTCKSTRSRLEQDQMYEIHKYQESLQHKRDELAKMTERLHRKEEKLKRKLEETEKKAKKKKDKRGQKHAEEIEEFDCTVVEHVTIPDGTVLAPGTRFTKSWLVRNTGSATWGAGVALLMCWGNMQVDDTAVDVPAVKPGQEVTLSVDMKAPNNFGTYQTHWRMHCYGSPFGHRVWCCFTVPSPKLTLASFLTSCNAKPERTTVTKQDSAVFMAGDDRKIVDEITIVPKYICAQKSESIGDHLYTQSDWECYDQQTPIMEDREKDIEEHSEEPELIVARELLGPRTFETLGAPCVVIKEDAFREALSLTEVVSSGDDSETGEDSSDDFILVPIPDCFNPDLPPGITASTSLLWSKTKTPMCKDDGVELARSQQSCALDSEQLKSSVNYTYVEYTVPTQEFERLELTGDELDQFFECGGEEAYISVAVENVARTEEEKIKAEENNTENNTGEGDPNGHAEEEEQQEEESSGNDDDKEYIDEDIVSTDGAAGMSQSSVTDRNGEQTDNTVGCQTGPEIVPNPYSLVSQAITMTTQVANKALGVAKDVFYTLQARSEYIPPQSTWTPKVPQWEPAADDYMAHYEYGNYNQPTATWDITQQQNMYYEQDQNTSDISHYITPGEQGIGQPLNTEYEAQSDGSRRMARTGRNPMDILMEMGFADRATNKQLLDKYKGDAGQVIAELLQVEDNDWAVTRH